MGYQQTKGYLEMEEGKVRPRPSCMAAYQCPCNRRCRPDLQATADRQEFRICLKVHKPAPRVNDLSIRLFVDGRNFHSEIYEYDEEEEYERCKVYMTGADGQQTTGRLQFSAMVGLLPVAHAVVRGSNARSLSAMWEYEEMLIDQAKTDEEAEADVPKDRIDELCSIVLLITEGKSISDGRMAVQTDSSIGKVYEKNLK